MGKTHLAIVLGKRLCQDGQATVCLPMNFLFEEIQAAKAAGRYLPYVRSLIKAKVLILDDWGLRTYTHEEAAALIDILAHIIHDRFYCNRRYAAATSQHAPSGHAGGQARPSRPQRTVSSTPPPQGAPRARLAWRLGGFVTNRHE